MSPEVKRCRSCGERIIWTVTAHGKRMPVDALPREDGKLSMLTEYPDGHPTAEYVNPTLFEQWARPVREPKAPEPRRYVSHFSTCKQSEQWRKS